jgi:hypothetical protein
LCIFLFFHDIVFGSEGMSDAMTAVDADDVNSAEDEHDNNNNNAEDLIMGDGLIDEDIDEIGIEEDDDDLTTPSRAAGLRWVNRPSERHCRSLVVVLLTLSAFFMLAERSDIELLSMAIPISRQATIPNLTGLCSLLFSVGTMADWCANDTRHVDTCEQR